MLKRIFKIILLFNLIITIIVPNYAAISVSDGSAFVTKAEFSADLNNLSNRMAQLENSLDAKIDSLVSSYLSRNGIWNGAKQTITKTQCNAYYNFVQWYGDLRSWNVGPSGVVPQSWATTSAQYTKPDTKVVTSRTAFTEPLNKSGLVYCRFDNLAYNRQKLVIIPRTNNTTSGVYMQGMNGSYSDWMQITNQNNTLLYRDDGLVGLVITGSFYLPIYYNKITFFFSNKGDTLYFQTDVNMTFGGISSDDSTTSWGRKWVFKEITVY